MEKFYIVSPESPVYKQYFEYNSFENEIGELYDNFAQKHGIETMRFVADADRLHIDPTAADTKKFGSQMRLDRNGLFKKQTTLNKEWVKLCKEHGLHTRMKPFLPFIFNVLGRCQYRLFHIGDVVYCTFESNSQFTAPPDFMEIKASEFYKIMEDAGLEMT